MCHVYIAVSETVTIFVNFGSVVVVVFQSFIIVCVVGSRKKMVLKLVFRMLLCVVNKFSQL